MDKYSPTLWKVFSRYFADRTQWVRLERLRSAVGKEEKWSGDGETDGTESERNALAEPQTEARTFCAFK